MKTPIIIFDKEKLKQNYKEFKKISEEYLKKYEIAYSVKTNSNKKLIQNLSNLNSGFEIASLNEIKLIEKYKKFRIFNSPSKTEQELKLAIKNNILINVDSISEMNKIINIQKGKELEIGLRITIEESKFGIQENRIEETIEYAKNNNLNVICLHFHQGTQLSIKEYEQNLIIFENIIQRLNNSNIKYLDVGGGFPDKAQLKNLNVRLEDYMILIKKYLSKFNKTIILEPGRAIVSDCFYLLTKVIAIKENFDKKYAILDAGINLLPKITLSQYKFTKYKLGRVGGDSMSEQNKQEFILAGPLLFSNDILAKYQGNLQENDIIKVENIGAYCYNLAWEISYKKPRIKI